MSLAFLSKKTWHVTNFSNQEAVWKAEQAKAEEERKMDEWRKKQEEERQIMELKRLQRESGQGPGGKTGPAATERVDFLYEVPHTKKEEYLLGKAVEIEPEESDVKKVEHLPGSNFLGGAAQNNLSSSANEEFNKHQRRGPLSAAEKEERLRQMMSDADAHDGDRKKRAKIDETRLAEEQAALSAAASAASADGADERGPSFVRDMARKVTGESSVAEQINQQKHYLQRGRGAGAETFTRR